MTTNIKDYSTTQASNTSLNSIDVDEGMLPSNLNNAIRALMKNTRDWFNDAQWIPTAVIGLQLNIPIFDGFARESKIERAKLDLEKAVREKDQLTESIRLEVANARIKYNNAVQKVTNSKENMALAQRIYKTTQIKYTEGLGSSLELNQAESALFVEQSGYIQALFTLLMAKAELEIALGK